VTESAVAVIALLVLGWAAVSGLLARSNVTGPLIFTLAGYLLANAEWGLVTVEIETASVHLAAEVALALVLFSDAARVSLSRLRHDTVLPLRLLMAGLPLAMIAGGLLAAWLLDDLTWGLAAFVGVALAPTDAALSAQVISDHRIPRRLRRALNVESGLNDGLATPVVAFFLAVAADQLNVLIDAEQVGIGGAIRELLAGVLVGVVLGLGSARLIDAASRRSWVMQGGRRMAILAVAIGAFSLAGVLDGNGFIAAFVAGLAVGAGLDRGGVDVDTVWELPELGGELLALLVWFLFGATLVPLALVHVDLVTVSYALLSLTLVRMVPVAVSLLGAGLDRPTVLFVGWFGPRGLASVVFAVLAIEALGEAPLVERAVATVALTVLLSVVLHGVSAGPFGRRYVQLEEPEIGVETGPRPRRLHLH
jgi:NhaP-type Na+/H+ or K+/H+ antiporter